MINKRQRWANRQTIGEIISNDNILIPIKEYWISVLLQEGEVGASCYTDGSKNKVRAGKGQFIEKIRTEPQKRFLDHNTVLQEEANTISESLKHGS